MPNKDITIEFTYLVETKVDKNGFRFLIPTNIATKYIPSVALDTE